MRCAQVESLSFATLRPDISVVLRVIKNAEAMAEPFLVPTGSADWFVNVTVISKWCAFVCDSISKQWGDPISGKQMSSVLTAKEYAERSETNVIKANCAKLVLLFHIHHKAMNWWVSSGITANANRVIVLTDDDEGLFRRFQSHNHLPIVQTFSWISKTRYGRRHGTTPPTQGCCAPCYHGFSELARLIAWKTKGIRHGFDVLTKQWFTINWHRK